MTSNPELARFAAFAGEDLTQDELIRAARATAAAGILATGADPFTGLLTGAGLTYADLLKTPEDGRRYELIDGSLLVSPTPSLRHQYVAGRLFRLLADSVGSDLVAGENSDVILDPGTERRTAIPDIYLADADGFWETTQHALPVAHLRLAVEIASPSSVTTVRVLKAELYAEAGVEHYWRVEFTSDDRHATCLVIAYRLIDGRYHEVQRAGAGELFAVHEPVDILFDPVVLTARP